jgi:hypothetical protein
MAAPDSPATTPLACCIAGSGPPGMMLGFLLARAGVRVPWAVKLLTWWPALCRMPGRLVGLGVLPEHVRTPDLGATP